jgi:hypothetical protein
MTPEDRSYYMLRAKQERTAAQTSPNRIVRGRHEELAWLYEMRLQFSDRADSHEAFEIDIGDVHEPVMSVGVAA